MVAQIRIVELKSMVLQAQLGEPTDPCQWVRGARHGLVNQALDAVGAEILGYRAQIVLEIGKMMVEATGRHTEPGGEHRQLQSGDTLLAQYVLPGAHPIGATKPAIARASCRLLLGRAVAK
jgi:hypothetical protein